MDRTFQSEIEASYKMAEKMFFKTYNDRQLTSDKMATAFYDGQRVAFKEYIKKLPLKEELYDAIEINTHYFYVAMNSETKSYYNGKVVGYQTVLNIANNHNIFKGGKSNDITKRN